MNLRIAIYVSLVCLAVTGTAWGQVTVPTGPDVVVGYQGLPSKTAPASASGVQVSESALLHIGVGVEAGYDSNVFYSDTDARGSAITRVVPFLELTNAGRAGTIPAGLFFDLGAALTYREYLSNDALIRDQRAFMPTAYANLEVGRFQTVGFAVGDTFARTEDPPYLNVQSLQPITRDVNQALASARWAPGGGRLAAVLSYTNTIDAFETDNLRIANSMANLLTLDTSWKWLPKTALVLQISQGYTTYFNTDPTTGATKPTSFPFHVMAGLRGLITAKLAVNLTAGYMNAFYDLPPDPNRIAPSGFQGNFSAMVDLVYRPTILTSINAGYRRDLQNAILGDFYYLDAVYLNVGQAIAGRLGLGLSVRYESRSFQNIRLPSTNTFISRHDNYWQAGANLDYHIRDWTYAGVAYTLLSNGSDYEQQAAEDPGRVNYVKQLVFARLGVTY